MTLERRGSMWVLTSDDGTHVHMIPVEAIASRMELLGIGPEAALAAVLQETTLDPETNPYEEVWASYLLAGQDALRQGADIFTAPAASSTVETGSEEVRAVVAAAAETTDDPQADLAAARTVLLERLGLLPVEESTPLLLKSSRRAAAADAEPGSVGEERSTRGLDAVDPAALPPGIAGCRTAWETLAGKIDETEVSDLAAGLRTAWVQGL